MSAEDVEHNADEEIVDYETEEPAADIAPVAETQQLDAQEADSAATAAADDAANADHAQAEADAPPTEQPAGGTATAPKAAAGSGDPLEEPPHGSEVFVGGIPKAVTVTDDQLREFASQGGEVYSCAVLKDPGSGLNRGYGFIKYKSKDVANAAMEKLNNTEMKDHPGHQIRVLPSQSKNRLYLGNLPKTITRDELEAQVRAATKGLESVELLMSKEIPGQNRGFCFLEFYNHACAQHAKAALSPPNFQVGNKPLTITFAEPRRADIAADQQNEIKSIFVGNLPDTATESKLREIFGPLGEITRAFIPAPRDGKTRREFGFVHYVDRASVLQAIKQNDEGEKFVMDGAPLDVKMGRVYHENPPPRFQQGGYGGQQGMQGFGGRGMGMGMGMGGRMGGRGGMMQQGMMGMGAGGRFGGGAMMQQQGAMGGYGMDDGYGGDDGYGYGGDEGFGGYAMGGGGGGMGGGMGMGAGMGMSGGMAAGGGGGGMQMVPMMLPNGQVGYVLSGAGGGMGGGGMGAGGMGGGMGGGMAGAGGMGGGMGAGGMGGGYGGPMRGRGFGGGGMGGGGSGGGAMRGRGGGDGGGGSYGNYGRGGGGGQTRYAPY